MRIPTIRSIALLGLLFSAGSGAADSLNVPMHLVSADGVGKPIGNITVTQDDSGLVLTPALSGLSPGAHGFHVHQNGSCAPATKDGKAIAAGAAGGHLDPEGRSGHGAPWGDGHLGDLPALFVAEDGQATQPVLAPRLQLSDLAGHALMIHAGGDNYADAPAPLGGGGARIACGVVP